MGREQEPERTPTTPRPRLNRAKTFARAQGYAAEIVQAAGFDLIELRLHGAPRGGQRLQLFIDRMPGLGAITVDDCAAVSRKLGALLEIELGDFDLEVSSPGMRRLLRGLDDFRRFAGVRARVTIESDSDSAQKETIIGSLATCDDETLRLELKGNTTRSLSRRSITKAVLDPTLEQWSEMGRRQAADVTDNAEDTAEERQQSAKEDSVTQGVVR